MSELRPDVDLDAFARPERRAPSRRRRLVVLLVPIVLVIAFFLLFADALLEWRRGAVLVDVARPRAASSTQASAAGVLFQAAGWVEPDPYPIEVTALTPGVVAEVLVLESAVVKKGDPVVRLVRDDAELELASAAALLSKATAERDLAAVEERIAVESFDARLDIDEKLGVATAEHASLVAEHGHRQASVEKGKAAIAVAAAEHEVQSFLLSSGAAHPWQVEVAAAKVEVERSAFAVLEADAAAARGRAEVAAARLERARKDAELRFEDRLRRDAAKARLALAQAALDDAAVRVRVGSLRVDRLVVPAPVDGVVLERLATIGRTLPDVMHGMVVATLYDPASLRMRVDIPQNEIAKVSMEQKVEILSDARRDRPYAGVVTRLVHKADIQKVTLQVHARIVEPDVLLRPEMLCQVRFLGSEKVDTARGGPSATVVIAKEFVLPDDTVWVLEATRRIATRRRIEVIERRDADVVVRGLNLSDKVLRAVDGMLEEGKAVRIREGGE